VRSN
jgi:thioredoxin reductase (NADPH)